MNTITKRSTAVAIATAIAATTFLWSPGSGSVAGAATADFKCTGVTDDVAGSVGVLNKSSKQLLDLLATLGGSAELTLPVSVGVTAPASVKTGSGPYNVTFDYSISLPASLVTSVKTILKLDKLAVTNASFAVDVSGAATGSIVGTTASKEVSLATSPVTVSQQITGAVTPDASGLVYYRPGATRLSVVVNGEVAGQAKIGTITVNCAATGLIGSTAVKPAGAPNIATNPLVVPAQANAQTVVKLDDGVKVLPDEGNPITWSSLKLVGNPSGGSATVANGSLTYTAPANNGTYDATYEICAASKTIVGTPGVTEVQTFKFTDPSYYQRQFNAHPIYFTLTFGGQETAPITTSFYNFLGFIPVAYDPNDEGSKFGHNWFGQFVAPTPKQLQDALEALPNVAPGDIVVAGGPTATDLMNPYTFTFSGALAKTDVGQIAVGKWVTWLPNEALAQVLASASSLGGGTPGVKPPTFDESFAAYLAQTITYDQFLAQWGDRIKFDLLAGINVQEILDSVTSWFPKNPATATTTTGEPAIPDSQTGPLCAQSVIQFVVTGGISANTTTTTRPATTIPAVVAGTTVRRTSATATGASRVQGTAQFAG